MRSSPVAASCGSGAHSRVNSNPSRWYMVRAVSLPWVTHSPTVGAPWLVVKSTTGASQPGPDAVAALMGQPTCRSAPGRHPPAASPATPMTSHVFPTCEEPGHRPEQGHPLLTAVPAFVGQLRRRTRAVSPAARPVAGLAGFAGRPPEAVDAHRIHRAPSDLTFRCRVQGVIGVVTAGNLGMGGRFRR
jgi:hypothetical protein